MHSHYKYRSKESLISLVIKYLDMHRRTSAKLDNATRKIRRLNQENQLLRNNEVSTRALDKIARLEDELQEYKAMAFMKSLTDKELHILRNKLHGDNSLEGLKALVKLQ